MVELYNKKNHEQVYEIHGLIVLDKMCASIAKNPCNFGTHWIIKIFLSLRGAYMVPRDQDKVVIYINNYIDWDQFNLLYDIDLMEKSIQNADAVAYKLGLASIKAINYRLKVARKEQQKREEMMKK